MKGASEDELIEHCTAVAREMPLIGFYLQTAVGGIPLSRAFWTRFAAIDNVVAIKVAPFNRYRTLDVAFGVAAAHAEERITLYTGNDDHIVADLVTPLVVRTGNREVTLRFRGGLLGHWSVWTRGAVKLLERLKLVGRRRAPFSREMLALDSFVTDCNSVVFDVDHDFAGCIPGCHEILRRQGLMTLDRVPRPARKAEPGPERRHRPALRDLSRAARRRLRRGQPRALAELSRWTISLRPTMRWPSVSWSRRARSACANWSTASIARLRKLNGPLNAITDFYDGALLDKSVAAAGEGPFQGVPFVVKQLMADCAGTPTTLGSTFFARAAGGRSRQRRRGPHAARRAGDRGPQQHQRVRPRADDGARLRRRDGQSRGARISRPAARRAARRRSLPRAACRWRTPPTAAARSAFRRRCAVCSG